jgi:hypothetical protein
LLEADSAERKRPGDRLERGLADGDADYLKPAQSWRRSLPSGALVFNPDLQHATGPLQTDAK